MEELFLPVLHSFENNNVFTGSYGALRFKVTPAITMKNPKEVDMEASSMPVSYTHLPRHTADEGKRSRKDGQFHGTSDVNKQQKTQSVGEDTKHILSDTLWTFRRVGHGVGQANSPPEKPNK